MRTPAGTPSSSPGGPSLAADAHVWLRIGCLSFGGPAGQIALMHRLLVDELAWISPARFAAGLDLCMLLPGPEAQQLATYVGWTRQGWRGGLVAGGLFVLPGAAVMLLLATLYVTWGSVAAVAALFSGVQCAVVAMVAQALARIARHTLGTHGGWAIAAAAFVALSGFAAPLPLVVIGAGLLGLLLAAPFVVTSTSSQAPPAATVAARAGSGAVPALVTAALWAIPLAALILSLGPKALLVRIALRMAELAVLGFGGAYALLAALAERAVADGWLSAAAMADGLALAETTPGPLILVLPFVAFVAAHGASSALAPAFVAALVALWTLFLPSFVWIFLAAPYLERLERAPLLRRAMRGVTAAVVGLILHLVVWLTLHVFFDELRPWRWGPLELALPRLVSLDLFAVAVTALSAVMLFVLRQSIGRTLAVAALLGLLRLAL